MKNLVFLISAPRSGSTLAQAILSGNSRVYSQSETWVLLPLVYMAHKEGVHTEYNHDLARIAWEDVLTRMPAGKDRHSDWVRTYYENMVLSLLEHNDKEIFIDKTPRYYLIYDELRRTFPQAKFVILLRHPVAVLLSQLKSWFQGRHLLRLRISKNDIYHAPDALIRMSETAGQSNVLLVQYEELIERTQPVIEQICSFCGLEFEPHMLEKPGQKTADWALGDTNIRKITEVDPSAKNKWHKSLEVPDWWRLAADYVDYLGPGRFEKLGYDYDEAQELIHSHHPGFLRKIRTRSLREILGSPGNRVIADWEDTLKAVPRRLW